MRRCIMHHALSFPHESFSVGIYARGGADRSALCAMRRDHKPRQYPSYASWQYGGRYDLFARWRHGASLYLWRAGTQ